MTGHIFLVVYFLFSLQSRVVLKYIRCSLYIAQCNLSLRSEQTVMQFKKYLLLQKAYPFDISIQLTLIN